MTAVAERSHADILSDPPLAPDRVSVTMRSAMMAARPPAVRAAATAPSPTAKSLPLAPAGTASNFAWSGKKTATLYRVTVPADPVLVPRQPLGRSEGAAAGLQCDAPPCGPPP